MKIVAVVALLTATLVAGCGNSGSTPMQQLVRSQPNSVWEFWVVNNLSVPMTVDYYYHHTCMAKGFPETMDLPAHSKFGTVIDTNTSGLCLFSDSEFQVNYHYKLAPLRLDYTEVIYELPWGADFWQVRGRNQANVPVFDERVGAPVQTYCSYHVVTVVCGVKQGRP